MCRSADAPFSPPSYTVPNAGTGPFSPLGPVPRLLSGRACTRAASDGLYVAGSLTSHTKERLPVPHPREHQTDAHGGNRCSDSSDHELADQEHHAQDRQGEKSQPGHYQAVSQLDSHLPLVLAPQYSVVRGRSHEERRGEKRAKQSGIEDVLL